MITTNISVNDVDPLAVGNPTVSFFNNTMDQKKLWSQSIKYFPLTQSKAKLYIYGWAKRSIIDCKLPGGSHLQRVNDS